MRSKTLRIADAADTANFTYQTFRRLSLNFKCDTNTDFEAWKNEEYTEDIHLVFQLYLHLQLLKNLPCACAVFAVIAEIYKDMSDPTSSYHTKGQPRLVCVANGRFVAWPGLVEHWWDTWRNDYIQADHSDVVPLYVTTAIHLDSIATLPLKQKE